MKRKSAQVLEFLNPCVLSAHQKQFPRRPCKVPALLGILLCTAGLLAVPERIFAQVPERVFAVAEVARQDLSYGPESPTRRSPTPSPTPTATRTPRPSPTPTSTRTPTATATATFTPTPTATFTPTPTATATATATAAPTATATPTATAVARALHGVIDLITD